MVLDILIYYIINIDKIYMVLLYTWLIKYYHNVIMVLYNGTLYINMFMVIILIGTSYDDIIMITYVLCIIISI